MKYIYTLLIILYLLQKKFSLKLIKFLKIILITILRKRNRKVRTTSKRKSYIIDLKINFCYFSVSQKCKKYKNNEKLNILKNYIEKNNELLLSEEQFLKAYILINEKVIKYKIPVNSPVAITLGGQPGAGKSNLYEIARKRFSNNIVELDLDSFRVFHPYYWQIKKIYVKNDVIKTNPFVFKIVDMLIDELSNKKII